MTSPDLDATRKKAREYERKGWVPLAYKDRTKKPEGKRAVGWTERTLSKVNIDTDFTGDLTNIGILLGEPSGGLVDVDLDCPEAVALAPRFLPSTPARFGRASKRNSHWEYQVEDPPPKTKQHLDPTNTDETTMLVELRSTRGQTMFPPSIHPSGEQVGWDDEGEPEKVEVAILQDAVRNLALAAILLRYWKEGNRNNLSLYVAGALLQNGWPDLKAKWLIDQVMQQAGDLEKRSPVETTRKKMEAKEPVKGLPALAEALGANETKLRALIGGKGAEEPDCWREKDPNIIARDFSKETDGIHHWRSDFYLWDKTAWKSNSDDDLFSKLRLWLEPKRVLNRKGIPVPFAPSASNIKEVAAALGDVFHLLDGQEAPFWIEPKEGDPAPVDLLPFRNGVLDLRTFELRTPDPRLFALHRVDCDYLPGAEAPTWDKFLMEIFPGSQDERIPGIEEIFGYCLTPDTSLQKAFLWQGAPRSGKGTLLRVLRALVGAERWSGLPVSSFGNEFGLQQLIGKAVAAIADARGQSRHDPHIVVERLLTITGEDAIGVNRKHKSHWDGKLGTRIIYASNVPPKLNDPSGVIVSRFIAVPFNESFLGREDPTLTDKLLAELPGIVNRSLKGLKRLRERGHFLQPECGKELLDRMEENTGPVRNFVTEECLIGPDHEIETQELFSAFKNWAMDHEHKQMASTTFGNDLFAMNLGVKKVKKRTGSGGEERLRIYQGIKLRPIEVPKGMLESWERAGGR